MADIESRLARLERENQLLRQRIELLEGSGSGTLKLRGKMLVTAQDHSGDDATGLLNLVIGTDSVSGEKIAVSGHLR